jgi:hypothetical protein
VFAYILLVGLPVLCLVSVLDAGRGLVAPATPVMAGKSAGAGGPAVTPLALSKLVLQIGVILILARLAGFLFRKINQPQVVGEMAAGIYWALRCSDGRRPESRRPCRSPETEV